MSLELRRRRYAKLDALVVDCDQAPKVPVILCHGYGAPGDDLVPNVEVLADLLEDSIEKFRFVFPAAPLTPPELAIYGGRAWWEINMNKLLAASQTGTFSELHDLEPPGLDVASELLAGCVRAVLDEFGGPGPYVLGGFSQGAMLTMNTALRSSIPPPSLLAQFSGTMVCRSQWQAALAQGRLANTFVLQSHGRYDTILPFSSAEALRDLLTKEKVEYHFVDFDGPHTIPMEALMQLAVKLKALAK